MISTPQHGAASTVIAQPNTSSSVQNATNADTTARAQRNARSSSCDAVDRDCRNTIAKAVCTPICVTGATAGGLSASGWAGVNVFGASSAACVSATLGSMAYLTYKCFQHPKVQPSN